METINKTVKISGVKTKVTFASKIVKETILKQDFEQGSNPKKTGVYHHVNFNMVFIINGIDYVVEKDFTEYRSKIMGNKSYKEVLTYKGFSVANSEKKMIEFILNN